MHYRLIISCPDNIGLVATVSGFIAEYKGFILEANHHSDIQENHCFMRFDMMIDISIEAFNQNFTSVAEQFAMQWQLYDASHLKRTVVLISKQQHCISDLLYRWSSQDLRFNFQAIISNYSDFEKNAQWHNIPFHYLPVDKNNKKQAFENLSVVLEKYQPEVIVLARYMQILPAEICEKYKGKIINIHHSFLPSFIGARPYHQAYKRGVKLIGATCHYVTEDLDAGPIIEQDVIRVDHDDKPEDMIRHGKDIEKVVLAKGLQYHLEDRVVIFNNKTIVF